MRQTYSIILFDGFYDVRGFLGFLYKLLVCPRRVLQVMRALLLYYHVFIAKANRMECWPANVHGKDRREELTSLRHKLVDMDQRLMTPAQKQRVLVIYEKQTRDMRLGFIFIFVVLLVLFVIIAWLLNYCW
jgi:hypothetical protein